MIDVKSQEIKPADNETYSDMQQLADELPDSSPRFILLSYPLTLVSIQARSSSLSYLWYTFPLRVNVENKLSLFPLSYARFACSHAPDPSFYKHSPLEDSRFHTSSSTICRRTVIQISE